MHRVELKVGSDDVAGNGQEPVPNAPCGVESKRHRPKGQASQEFLMHRVELKAGWNLWR